MKISGALAVLLMVGGALYGAYAHGDSVANARWEAKVADQQILQAMGLAAATESNHVEERRRQDAADEVGNERATKSAENQTDAAVSTSAAGLREQTRQLATADDNVFGYSAATDQCAGTRRACLVLSKLLDRSVETNRELAADRDAASDAELICERAYDAVRKP